MDDELKNIYMKVAKWHRDLLNSFHSRSMKNTIPTVISEMSQYHIYYQDYIKKKTEEEVTL